MPYLLFCGYTLTNLQAITLSSLDKHGINPGIDKKPIPHTMLEKFIVLEI